MPMKSMKLWIEKLRIILKLCIMSIILTPMHYSEVPGKVRCLVASGYLVGNCQVYVNRQSVNVDTFRKCRNRQYFS